MVAGANEIHRVVVRRGVECRKEGGGDQPRVPSSRFFDTVPSSFVLQREASRRGDLRARGSFGRPLGPPEASRAAPKKNIFNFITVCIMEILRSRLLGVN